MGALTWGIEFNVWLQTFGSPLLDGLFKAITVLGNEESYLVLIPLVYWCFDSSMHPPVYALRLPALFVSTFPAVPAPYP